ncbi:MAG TPA: hypothetical protein PKE27_13475 [Povalibacter sp.]|uniref:hypothetical protein n=1 Tax=Povalibacter sp. TaxID=1962978 RepID=UPI002C2BCC41|nr:hypothetical protein [Povalibacter sp.]HMN45589.1 hypothetical protein [Povalibacter sp.]
MTVDLGNQAVLRVRGEDTVSSSTRLSSDPFEIFLEAMLQVRLECHLWKAHFIHLSGHSLPEGTSADYRDVWDLMLAKWIPEYSPENYRRYAPLFDNALRDLRLRFDRLIVVFSRVLPRDVRKRMEKAIRQLDFAAASYRWIPARTHIEDPAVLFAARFKGVIRVLGLIARDADERLRTMVD